MNAVRRYFASFWDKPSRALSFYIFVSVVIWTLQCTLLQNVLGGDAIELITWGRQPVLGHQSHPALLGWIGYGAAVLSGHHDWSSYFLNQVFIGISVWFTYKTIRLFWDEYSSVTAAALLYFLYYYTPSWMKLNMNVAEMAIRPVIAYFFFRSVESRRICDWLLFGFFAAVGIWTKYSCGMWLASILIIFLIDRDYRRQLATPGPWLAIIVFAIVIAPHIVWLFQNDFICFRYVGNELDTKCSPFMPLFVFGTSLYPLAMEALAMFMSWLPSFRVKLQRKTFDKKLFVYFLILEVFSKGVLFVMACTGQNIILIWLSAMTSCSGILVVSLFPFVVDRTIFKRVFLWLVLFTSIMYIACTVDLLFRSHYRLHADPYSIAQSAIDEWNRIRPGEPMRHVVGGRWVVQIVENYSDIHPRAYDLDDVVAWKLMKDEILKDGSVLIGTNPNIFERKKFFERAGYPGEKIKWTRHHQTIRSLLGKPKDYFYYIGYLPSEKEREAESAAEKAAQNSSTNVK